MATEDETKVSEAVDRAFSVASPDALSYTQTADQAAETKRFIIQGPGYYELQNYLNQGMQLPSSNERFEAMLPKAKMQDLLDLDSSIYRKTSETFVDVQNHCTAFNNATFGKFLIVTGSIITFCNDMARYLGGKDLLQDQIKIMTKPGIDHSSDAFKDASQAAAYILRTLSQRAVARKADCEKLVVEIKGFEGVLDVDKGNVDFLYKQYMTGPVVDSSGNPKPDQQPYVKVLQSELAEKAVRAVALGKEIRDNHEQWKTYTIVASTSVTYMIIPLLGHIAMLITMATTTSLAVKMKEAEELAKQALAKNTKEQEVLGECIKSLTPIYGTMSSLQKSMSEAKRALESIGALFNKQAEDFRTISDNLGSVDSNLRASYIFKPAVNSDIEACKAAWAEIKILALDFMENSKISYKKDLPK